MLLRVTRLHTPAYSTPPPPIYCTGYSRSQVGASLPAPARQLLPSKVHTSQHPHLIQTTQRAVPTSRCQPHPAQPALPLKPQRGGRSPARLPSCRGLERARQIDPADASEFIYRGDVSGVPGAPRARLLTLGGTGCEFADLPVGFGTYRTGLWEGK